MKNVTAIQLVCYFLLINVTGANAQSVPLQLIATNSELPTNNGIYLFQENDISNHHAIISARVAGVNSGNALLSFDVSGESGWAIGIDNSDENKLKFAEHWFSLSTGTMMTLTRANGFLGIGTSSPSSKLEVNGGDIRVTGGEFIDDGTTLNVPDYVFHESYELNNLTAVENYIIENNHLENIPSMHDVEGWAALSLQERDMKFLEKIEELTLYAIDQNKRLNQYETTMAILLKRIGALESLVSNLQEK